MIQSEGSGQIGTGLLRIETFQKPPLHRLPFPPDAPAYAVPIPSGIVQCLLRGLLANVRSLDVDPQDIEVLSLSFQVQIGNAASHTRFVNVEEFFRIELNNVRILVMFSAKRVKITAGIPHRDGRQRRTHGIESEQVGDFLFLRQTRYDIVPTPVEIGCTDQGALHRAPRSRAVGQLPFDARFVPIEVFLGPAPTTVCVAVPFTVTLEIFEKAISARARVEVFGGRRQFFEGFDPSLIVDLRSKIVGEREEPLGMKADPPFPCDEVWAAKERPAETSTFRTMEKSELLIKLFPSIRHLQLFAVFIRVALPFLGIIDPILAIKHD